MCEECRRYPCHPSCPNAEPVIVCNCEICGDDIHAGETVYTINGKMYCETCIDDCREVAEPQDDY